MIGMLLLYVFLVLAILLFFKLGSFKFRGRSVLPLSYRVGLALIIPLFVVFVFMFLSLVFVFVLVLLVVGFIFWLIMRNKRFK